MALARASAAGLMFNVSTLLLTMSRNTITLLRETFLHLYIPFDSAIPMHKLVAWIALFFTGKLTVYLFQILMLPFKYEM